MIGTMTLSQAAIAHGGTLLYPDCTFTDVSTDTRSLEKGQLFVALKGENFDGHRFLAEAAAKACGLVVSRPDKSLPIPQWVVADTTVALGQLASLNRRRFGGRLVALTGSTGKTTVKEMLATILSVGGPTLATRGNLNNHIGVPKTVLELSDEHQYAVIEMGASGPGEIAYLCQVAGPDIGLVTNVMPAHIEGFGSEAVIADTKGAVYSHLNDGGVAVINLDDHWARKWQNMAGNRDSLTFSLTDGKADVRAADIDVSSVSEARFTLQLGSKSHPVVLRVPGRHNVANALAAAACAEAAGLELFDIVSGLEGMRAVKGRTQQRRGIADALVLDDTYNANPGSVRAAIDVLASQPGRRILVLGDMGELGSMSNKAHREVGQYAAGSGIDEFYVVGRYAEHSARGYGARCRVFDTRQALADTLKQQLDSSTTVLVKGSRSAAMETVVAAITVGGDDASMAG